MSVRIINSSETVELIPNGSPNFMTKAMRKIWQASQAPENTEDKLTNAKRKTWQKQVPGKTKQNNEDKLQKQVPGNAERKTWLKQVPETTKWWMDLGSRSNPNKEIKHKNNRLENQLPMPRTILGAQTDRNDIVLVRMRSVSDCDLLISSDDVIEFTLQGKKKLDYKSPILLK
jgi:hypothetical protein